jgi:hypothetical protein
MLLLPGLVCRRHGGREGRRRYRHAVHIRCDNRRSFTADELEDQMALFLTDRMRVPDDWHSEYLRLVATPAAAPDAGNQRERAKLERALVKLQDLYKWKDMTREEYLREKDDLLRRLASLADTCDKPVVLADVRRAAELLQNVGQLWHHPGIDPRHRDEFIDEVFEEILFDNEGIRRVTPRAEYRELVAIADDVELGGIWSGRQDSNLRPPDPQSGALPG